MASFNTSSELLGVTGCGTSRSVVENLLKQSSRPTKSKKLKTFKVARSPLLDQLQTFLSEFQRSNDQLLSRPQQQLSHLDIENTDDDEKVIEMNVFMGQRNSEDQSNDEEEEDPESSKGNVSASNSEDDLQQSGRVTAENFRLPGSGSQNKHRNFIQVVTENTEQHQGDKEERSDEER